MIFHSYVFLVSVLFCFVKVMKSQNMTFSTGHRNPADSSGLALWSWKGYLAKAQPFEWGRIEQHVLIIICWLKNIEIIHMIFAEQQYVGNKHWSKYRQVLSSAPKMPSLVSIAKIEIKIVILHFELNKICFETVQNIAKKIAVDRIFTSFRN